MTFGGKIVLIQKFVQVHMLAVHVFSSLWVSHIQRYLGSMLRYWQSITWESGNRSDVQAVTVKKGELTVGHVTRFKEILFIVFSNVTKITVIVITQKQIGQKGYDIFVPASQT